MDGSQELVQLPPFTDAHRAFLQIMLANASMPVREAKQLFHELVEEFSVEGNPDFEQAVESMQSVLSNLRLSLTRTRNAARTEDILSLVMDAPVDDISKGATALPPELIRLIRLILGYAFKQPSLEFSVGDLRESLKSCKGLSHLRDVLNHMVDELWIEPVEDRPDRFRLASRARAELKPVKEALCEQLDSVAGAATQGGAAAAKRTPSGRKRTRGGAAAKGAGAAGRNGATVKGERGAARMQEEEEEEEEERGGEEKEKEYNGEEEEEEEVEEKKKAARGARRARATVASKRGRRGGGR